MKVLRLLALLLIALMLPKGRTSSSRNSLQLNNGDDELSALVAGLGDLDDANVDKVVDILRSNVEQWSFVESQLLEPAVNLAMVSIHIIAYCLQ